MFEFAWSAVLLLLPLPLLVRLLPAKEVAQQVGLYIPFADDYRVFGAKGERSKSASQLIHVLLWLMWLCLVLAAAKPQWVGEPIELKRTGRDVMMAVDLSGSMQIEDFVLNDAYVDRLTATKAIAGDFIQRREGDRIGLILFGSQAYLQAPLTFDRGTVNTFLQESAIGLAGKETAIGDAIGLAVKRLQAKQQTSDLVLVLLTDGVNTAGELKPEDGLALAKKIGLRIHTIGIGASSMEVTSFLGRQTVNPSRDLDEAMLKKIAGDTGGKYFRAHDSKELMQVYALIDALEPVARESELFRPVQALFFYPLTLAMLLGFGLMFRNWRV